MNTETSLLSANLVSLIRSSRHLVASVTMQLQAGELVGLVGPNGAGKSSLLSLLAGLVACDQGQVYLGQTPIQNCSAEHRARKLAWVEQSAPIHWPLQVERIVTLGRLPHLSAWQSIGKSDQVAIESALSATDCLHLRKQRANTLSGGERTRMLLARALATEPDILLADEPVAALDLGHQLQTMQLLRNFAQSARACLVVLHDLSMAARYCDRVYLMNEGSIQADGSAETVLSKENIARVYGVEVEIGAGEFPWIVPLHRV